MKKFNSRDLKFFILGVCAMLVFSIIYDWSDFKKGLMGEPSSDNIKTEKVETK